MVAAGCALAALVAATPARAAEGVSVRFVTPGQFGTIVGGGLGLLVRPAEVRPRPCPRETCPVEVLLERRARASRVRMIVLGGRYQGLLLSAGTRIPGLVSPADLKPLALRSRASADAAGEVARLDGRLRDAAAARAPAAGVLVGLVLLLATMAFLLRLPLLGRAALLSAPLALVTAVLLAWLGVSDPLATVLCVAAAASAGAVVAASGCRDRRALAAALLAPFALLLGILAIRTDLHTLSAFGPRAEDGGRFYGVPNREETLLLVPALLGAALLGRRAMLPVAVLAAATVGLSWTGADGGGLLVLAAGFLVLAARLLRVEPTPRRLAVGVAAVVALSVAVATLDAATGGDSHVTRAVRGGPGELWHDLTRRADLSVDSLASPHAALLALIGLSGLVFLSLRRPRSPVRDAVLVALAVSLVVNDSPLDALGYGSAACTALWSWERLSVTSTTSA